MTILNGRRPTCPHRLVVARMMGLSAVTFLGISTAHPHDLMRPQLNAWFQSLTNKAGDLCCDTGDGQPAEVEWDMAKGGYRVLLKHPHRPAEPGQWFDVPYSVVIDQPNLSGIAMVWWHPFYSDDGRMTPVWRCFIAGPGGSSSLSKHARAVPRRSILMNTLKNIFAREY